MFIGISFKFALNSEKDNGVIHFCQEGLDVTVTPTKDVYYLGGPVGFHVKIQNTCNHEISLDIEYPRISPISFYSTGDAIKNKSLTFMFGIFSSVLLRKSDSYEDTYYANRYVDFLKAGEVTVGLAINIQGAVDANKNGRPISVGKSGVFNIKIKKPTDDELKSDIDFAAKGLSVNYPPQQMESIEALAFLNNHYATHYLEKALNVPRMLGVVVHTLAEDHTPESNQVLKDLLKSKDSTVVEYVMKEIIEKNIAVDRSTIEALLSTNKRNFQYFAMLYIKHSGDPQYLEMVVMLRNNPNKLITNLANEFIEKHGSK